MGDPTSEFSLTPEEQRFFVRFFRRLAVPYATGIGALAGGVTALLVAWSIAGGEGTSDAVAPRDSLPLESAALAPPLVDDGARARLSRLQEELGGLRAQLDEIGEKAVERPTGRVADPKLAQEVASLGKALQQLKRELQGHATTLASLRNQPSVPAAAAAGDTSDIAPLQARLEGVEARLTASKELRERIFELENRQRSETKQMLERLYKLEQSVFQAGGAAQ
jgi:hypothetical protein